MLKNVRLSVVMPGRNTKEVLWRNALVSVLRAMGPDDELLCVDDGSTIDTSWLDKEAQSDPRVKVIRLGMCRGVSFARNEALNQAHGQYVTFVDSDDEVSSECFELCVEKFKECPVDIVFYGVRVIWVNDGLYRELSLPDTEYGNLTADALHEICQSCLFDYSCNKVYRREFLDAHSIRFDPEVRMGEDVIFNLSCVMANAKWQGLAHVGYIYYRRDGTALGSYIQNLGEAYRRRDAAWRSCARHLQGEEILSSKISTCIDQESARAEWSNVWRRNSPLNLRMRWNYLCTHRLLTDRPILFKYVFFLLHGLFRRYFYLRPFRRSHTRKMYPDVKDWKGIAQQ